MEALELIPDQCQNNKKTLSVTTLSLAHFRNYSAARIEVSSAPVVLTGRNGVGKTNILEAISLLTPGRGIRRAKLSELDAINPLPLQGGGSGRGPGWAISSNINGMQGDVKIGTGRDTETYPLPASPLQGEEKKRIVKIDGKPARSQAELARHFAIIWLTPQMEQLFQDSTSAGRKFLDRLVYSFDPEHASRVNEYDFAMRERNRLLQNNRADSVWLDALEQTMAETAAAIAQARLHTVQHINHAIGQSTLSFPKAHLSVMGTVENLLNLGTADVAVEEDFKRILRNNRHQDAASGRTLAGIHRSELQVIHVIKQMPAGLCSTGEQKALLLSIVLAQARAGAQWHGVIPVLLLDEVIAHLDATRRRELFEEICQIGAQTWMTGTDAALFAGLEKKAQYFQVENGQIS